jgi:dTDP-4-amino-4,6-dideoxygalactose transaminase
MNISTESIIASITPKTKAIVVVHYGGVACNMDIIEAICQKNNLILIEDAAHSFNCFYQNKRLGTIGHYGAISFDHTKNIHCSQGGALIVNDSEKVKKVATVFENGTNREDFLNKDVPYFEWVSLGSKYALSELNAAFLLPQLESSSIIIEQRVLIWKNYYELLKKLSPKFIDLPVIPEYAKHNGHIFYIKLKNQTERNNLKAYLGENNIQTTFHFIPLHNSKYGKKHAIIKHRLINTELESERLLRLPIYHGMNKEDVITVVKFIRNFFES